MLEINLKHFIITLIKALNFLIPCKLNEQKNLHSTCSFLINLIAFFYKFLEQKFCFNL